MIAADTHPLQLASKYAARSGAFREWFAGSKAVNDDGSPKVVFHGTEQSFDEFLFTEDIGFHFGTVETANARLVQMSGGGELLDGACLMPVFLQVRNPLRMPDLFTWGPRDVAFALVELGVVSQDEAFGADIVGLDEVREWLEAKGFDGIVYRNETEGGGDSFIVFDSRQVKSATGNRGSFDACRPDIGA